MICSSDLLLMVSPPFTIPVFMEVSGIRGFVNPQTCTTGSMKSKLKQKTKTQSSFQNQDPNNTTSNNL